MRFAFLMDPLETVNVEKDTSFILMVGAERRGHEVCYLPRGGISLCPRGEVVLDVVPVVTRDDPAEPFVCRRTVRLGAAEVEAIFVRSDPPFDESYLRDTWLLDRVPRRTVVINEPAGLRAVSEKLWVTRFTELVPATLITRHRDLYQEFLDRHQEIIAKPVNAFGGAGVFLVRRGDTNAAVIFETLTAAGATELIAQPFIPQAREGDKRVLLLDGEPLGAMLRIHCDSDHRNNLFAGGKPSAVELNPRDRQIAARLRPELQRLGLHLVGIDIIGPYLIEVNITSPTGMQEIDRLTNQRLEDQVIAHVEGLVKRRQAGE